MRTNYLLIDFENVQPKSLALLDGVPFKVYVFHGANQNKVPIELARELQKLGKDAEYVQIEGNGRNAADFHIAFTIGELSKADPNGYFHIISKDTGFDPLIRHAKKRKVFIQRSRDIAEIPLLKLSNAKTRPEKITAIVTNLASRGQSRPRKIKTLSSTINSLFQKSLSEAEVAEIISALRNAGHIVIEGDNVSYQLIQG